jgi:hypothetical protein
MQVGRCEAVLMNRFADSPGEKDPPLPIGLEESLRGLVRVAVLLCCLGVSRKAVPNLFPAIWIERIHVDEVVNSADGRAVIA